MRFISHSRNFAVQILPPIQEILPGGLIREVVPLYVARFEQGQLTLEELEFAERVFTIIPGRSTAQDEVTMTPITNRLSVYDTESQSSQQDFDTIDRALDGQSHPLLERGETWAYGTMQKVTEKKLTLRAVETGEFALFAPEPTAAPWPAYNEFPGSPEDLLAVLEAQGHYLPGVLAYEQENLGRPEIVSLLKQRINEISVAPAEEFVS